MYNRNHAGRGYALIFLAGVLFFLCAVRLVRLQIVNGSEYRNIADRKLYISLSTKAPRGEILDRYGNVLVGNRNGFAVQIQDTGMDKTELADLVGRLIALLEKSSVSVSDAFPMRNTEPLSFSFRDADEEAEWKAEYDIAKEATATEVLSDFANRYGVRENLSVADKRKIVGVLYDMEIRGFSESNPYTLASDVPMTVVAVVKENNLRYPSVEIVQENIRYYPNGQMAAHILGTVGIIYQEEYETLKDKGYAMDSVIGKQGVEYTFEDDLRGKDGLRSIARTDKANKNIVNSVAPVPGNQVLLTLDADIQETMERMLEETIQNIQQTSAPDCDAGAAVCLDVNTGEVLGMASYPTYNPADYNKEYNTLLENSAKPLWNRALAGTYEPGSTFKMLTAIAALEEGVVTTTETILDEGQYKYYEDYQPICLEWRYGKTHGYVNTELALQESCNYYFYEIGRRLGIEHLALYAKKFGLGQLSGIEIGGEATGTVAEPAEREARGEQWYAGDTLQAAIGQSDNLFTPIQLASYTATIANGGTRYKPHLLKCVKNTQTGQIVREGTAEVQDKIEMSEATLQAVKNGMKKVTEEGTAQSAFADFEIAVAGKTGTAEVPNGSSNGIFVAFAPFDNPQIAIAIVIEHGNHGASAAPIARAVFETYFENQKISDAYVAHTLLQ